MAIPLIGAVVGLGAAFGLMDIFPPIAEWWRQTAYLLWPTAIPDVSTLIVLRRRKLISPEQFYDGMRRLGYSQENADKIYDSTMYYPSPTDLVTWQAREVFEPDSIRKYGLDAEFERIRKEPFYKAGMDDEQIQNYWRAHWMHPAWVQVATFLHRRLMEEGDVWEWFRLVEIPPFWRDKFIKAAYEPYTRVDIRRMWDMRTVNEQEVYDTYRDLGYDDEHARNLVLWTKVYTGLPDLLAQYRNGWITEGQVVAKLVEWGMPKDRAVDLARTKVRNPFARDRLDEEYKQLKQQILKAWLGKQIDDRQAIEFLEKIGYSREEATFTLAIYEAAAGSPETPLQWAAIVEKFREAAGMEARRIPPELLEAEKAFTEAWKAEKEAIKQNLPEHVIEARTLKKLEAEQRYIALLQAYGLTDLKVQTESAQS